MTSIASCAEPGESPSAGRKTSVSLVLGSGGARGMAHIGAIHWLEEHGYEIRSVSGCSIGALVGGAFAAGKLNEFENWICAVTEREMFRLLDLSWSISGLVKGDRIIDLLKGLIGERMIEDLPVRYTAVAASIDSSKEVWLQTGSLFEAIRASMALPLLVTPRVRNGIALIDGGVLNPVPIAPTFGDTTDLCIAVNLGGAPTVLEEPEKNIEIAEPPSGFAARISDFVDRLRPAGHSEEKRDWGPFEIANQAFDAMQATISRQKLAAYPPDVLIEIPRNACGALEFQRAAEMIELGRKKAAEALHK